MFGLRAQEKSVGSDLRIQRQDFVGRFLPFVYWFSIFAGLLEPFEVRAWWLGIYLSLFGFAHFKVNRLLFQTSVFNSNFFSSTTALRFVVVIFSISANFGGLSTLVFRGIILAWAGITFVGPIHPLTICHLYALFDSPLPQRLHLMPVARWVKERASALNFFNWTSLNNPLSPHI